MEIKISTNRKEFDRLNKRIRFLERTNQKYLQALELLASLGDLHRDVKRNGDLSSHFASTRKYLNKLIDFEAVAFFAVNEADMSFQLVDCHPESERGWMQNAIDRQIESGNFAWALHQNRASIINDKPTDSKIILHTLATRTRTLGMFTGRIGSGSENIPTEYLTFISNILYNTGYAIENGMLYAEIEAQNKILEKNIDQQTEQLKRKERELEDKIRERRQMQTKIKHLAFYDSLTGLPNRNLLMDRLALALVRAKHVKRNIILIFLDINNFKIINESLGHSIGDLLLKELSKRLVHSLRKDDDICRVEGDKFALLVPEVPGSQNTNQIVENVFKAIKRPFTIDTHEIFLNLSMGVAMYPRDGSTPEIIFKNAETAMHHAKKRGRNIHQHYNPSMHNQATREISLETGLRRALERNEFLLHYQPKIDLKSGKLVGMEALLRWNRKGHGLISPREFIPIAEESRLILPIGEWVLQTACEQIKVWERKGLQPVNISVNLSGHQCKQRNLNKTVRNIIEQAGVAPEQLELEITETVLMENSKSALKRLNAIKEMGVHLSIDDFGTGYSSLAYLKNMPVHTLKIDQSFVRGLSLTSNPTNGMIVQTIISLAKALNLKTVAEGAEHKEESDFLREAGCDALQGYYISKPLPVDAMTAFLQQASKNLLHPEQEPLLNMQ